MKYKKAIIGESEKFVMQHKTMYEESIAVAISGSSIHSYQVELLRKLGVEEVIIATDKEFENKEEEKAYMNKIQKSFVSVLCPFFVVSVLWDTESELELKMAPTDKGKEVFESIYKKRIIL